MSDKDHDVTIVCTKHILKHTMWLVCVLLLSFILLTGCDSSPLSLAIGHSSKLITDDIVEPSPTNETQRSDTPNVVLGLNRDSMPFFVILKNNSKRSFLYSEESNPFGYDSLRFEARLTGSNQTIKIKKKPTGFDQKGNHSLVLASGDQLVIPVMLFKDSHGWENTDGIVNAKAVELRAMFTQRPYWRDRHNTMTVGEEITIKSDWYTFRDRERVNLSDYMKYEKTSWRPNQPKKKQKTKTEQSLPYNRGMDMFDQEPPHRKRR